MIVVDYFQEVPIILMASRYNERNGNVGQFVNVVAVMSLEKFSGKRLYDKNSKNNEIRAGGRTSTPSS